MQSTEELDSVKDMSMFVEMCAIEKKLIKKAKQGKFDVSKLLICKSCTERFVQKYTFNFKRTINYTLYIYLLIIYLFIYFQRTLWIYFVNYIYFHFHYHLSIIYLFDYILTFKISFFLLVFLFLFSFSFLFVVVSFCSMFLLTICQIDYKKKMKKLKKKSKLWKSAFANFPINQTKTNLLQKKKLLKYVLNDNNNILLLYQFTYL